MHNTSSYSLDSSSRSRCDVSTLVFFVSFDLLLLVFVNIFAFFAMFDFVAVFVFFDFSGALDCFLTGLRFFFFFAALSASFFSCR